MADDGHRHARPREQHRVRPLDSGRRASPTRLRSGSGSRRTSASAPSSSSYATRSTTCVRPYAATRSQARTWISSVMAAKCMRSTELVRKRGRAGARARADDLGLHRDGDRPPAPHPGRGARGVRPVRALSDGVMADEADDDGSDAAHWAAVEEATELLHEERFREAMVELRGVLEEDPKNPYAYYFLGIAFFEVGELEPARDAYAACVKLAPGHLGARVALCHVLRMPGRRPRRHPRGHGGALAGPGRPRRAPRRRPRVPRARRRRGGAQVPRGVPRDEPRVRGRGRDAALLGSIPGGEKRRSRRATTERDAAGYWPHCSKRKSASPSHWTVAAGRRRAPMIVWPAVCARAGTTM